jgi:hypothetical protein
MCQISLGVNLNPLWFRIKKKTADTLQSTVLKKS